MGDCPGRKGGLSRWRGRGHIIQVERGIGGGGGPDYPGRKGGQFIQVERGDCPGGGGGGIIQV